MGHARELRSSTLTAEQARPSLDCRPRAGACPSHPLPSWVPHHHGVCAPQAVRLAQLAVVVEHLTQHPPPGIQRLRLGGGGCGKPGCAAVAKGSSAIRGCALLSATADWLWLCMWLPVAVQPAEHSPPGSCARAGPGPGTCCSRCTRLPARCVKQGRPRPEAQQGMLQEFRMLLQDTRACVTERKECGHTPGDSRRAAWSLLSMHCL